MVNQLYCNKSLKWSSLFSLCAYSQYTKVIFLLFFKLNFKLNTPYCIVQIYFLEARVRPYYYGKDFGAPKILTTKDFVVKRLIINNNNKQKSLTKWCFKKVYFCLASYVLLKKINHIWKSLSFIVVIAGFFKIIGSRLPALRTCLLFVPQVQLNVAIFSHSRWFIQAGIWFSPSKKMSWSKAEFWCSIQRIHFLAAACVHCPLFQAGFCSFLAKILRPATFLLKPVRFSGSC